MSFRFGSGSSANARVTYTGGAPDPQSGFTVCGWFYLSSDRNDFSTFYRSFLTSGNITRMTLATKTDGVTPAVFSSGNTGGVAGLDVFTVGSWMFIAVTQTGTTATIYTCTPYGTMRNASGTSSGGSVPDSYTIGGRSATDASEFLDGRARNVRQWSAVLTEAELITEMKSAVSAARTANLYSDHQLRTGTDLSDVSGNGRTLTAGSSSGATENDLPLCISNKFEGGTNGATITTGNSGGTSGYAFDAVNVGTGATTAYDTAHAAHGSLGFQMATTGTASASDVQWTTTIGNQSTIYGRFYMYKTANPASPTPGSVRIATIATAGGAALVSGLYLMPDGTILGTDTATGTAVQTTVAAASNAWIRIEYKVVVSATVGQVEVKLFNTADSTIPSETVTSAANKNTSAGPAAIYSVGMGFDVKAGIGPIWFDDIAFDPYDYVGPAAGTEAWTANRATGRTSTTDVTSHPITLPANRRAGDLLLAVVSTDGNPTCTDSSGNWTKLGQTSASTIVTNAIFYRTATNNALDNLTVTTSAGEQSSHVTLDIRAGDTPQGTSASNGTGSTNSDPPSLTPSGGSAAYLWVVTRAGDSTVVATVAPTNFNQLQSIAASGTSGASTNTAERQFTGSTLDPGTFTSATEQWVSYTLAVPFKSSSVDYANSQTDAEGITDSRIQLITVARTQTDAVGLVDARTVVRTSARSQTDTAGITDSVTAAIGKGATITDAVGITDAATRVVAARRTVTDHEDIDDPQSQTNDIVSSGSDDVGITDTVTRVAGKGATITNTVGITDAQARTVAAARTQTDVEGITDSRATTRTVARAQTDLAGITDARAAGLGVQRTITDAENLTDSRATTTAFGRTSTDSVGITDSESIDGSKSGSTTNTVGITDAAAKTQAITRSITDQVGLVDSNFDGDQEEFANAVGITDSITVVRGVGAVVTNAVGITDAALRALAARRALTDSSDVFSYGRINAASDVDDGSIGIADEMLQTVGYEPIITDSIDIADDALTGTTYLDLVGITDEVDVVNRVVFIEIVDSIRLIDPPDVIRDSNVELADELGLIDQQTDYKFRVAVITDTVNPRDAGAFNPDLFRGIKVLLTGMGVAGLTVESLATVPHAVSGPGIEPIVSTGPAAAARKTSGPHVARTVTGPEV